jgi:choline dehydrogenase-like flavoprotein
VATGVSLASYGNVNILLNATCTREVILSAGTIKSPTILEYSGIGNQSILQSFGIPVNLNLPTVGENLQDHHFVPFTIQLPPGSISMDTFAFNSTFQPIAFAEWYGMYGYPAKSGPLASGTSLLGLLTASQYLNSTQLAIANSLYSAQSTGTQLSSKQLALIQQFNEQGAPFIEVLAINTAARFDNPSDLTCMSVYTSLPHPLSRGSVHLGGTQPLISFPAIVAQTLAHPFDAYVLTQAPRFLNRITTGTSFSKWVTAVLGPLPNWFSSDSELTYWASLKASSMWHVIGTAAMLPRADGGVVDTNLKVYGTTNVRVVDASIMPLHVSGHLSSLVYAIALKAADAIIAARTTTTQTTVAAAGTSSSTSTPSTRATTTTFSTVTTSTSTSTTSTTTK